MAQFLRPDGNVTQTSFTGGFADIDESTASDADFAYGADRTASTLEVSLTDPSGTPGSGTCTVRYRIAKVDGGVYPGTGGNSLTITAEVYEGASLIAGGGAITAPDAWTDQSFTFAASGVTDWNNLRLRFTTTSSGGSPANARGGAVSWAEIETPDAAPLEVVAAGGLSFAGALTKTASLSSAVLGQVSLAGALSLVKSVSQTVAGALSFAGALSRQAGTSAAGAMTPEGSLVTGSVVNRAVDGEMGTAGALVRSTTRGVAGDLSFAGSVVRSISFSQAGSLSFGGSLGTTYIPLSSPSGLALQRTQD